MTKWYFPASSTALHAPDATRGNGVICLDRGQLLFGPYIDIPAGRVTAHIHVQEGGQGLARADLCADRGTRLLAVRDIDLAAVGERIDLAVELDEPAFACEVRLHNGPDATARIRSVEITLDADTPAPTPDRPVGYESRKTYRQKVESGFIAQYLSGASILEVGYVGYFGGSVPIVPQAIGVDIGYPGYDGRTFPFADASFDAIYSSHCYEHIPNYVEVLQDWFRMLKIGGFMVIVVPHQHLFEKRRRPPSRGNVDHKRFYTSESLLREIGEALEENRWRVRHMRENDEGFNYEDPPNAPSHGLYEIELVIEKIAGPVWHLDDQSVRPYSPREFDTHLHRPDPWLIELEPAATEGPAVWGPWIGLGKADYLVDYYFRPVGWDAGMLEASILCEVRANDRLLAQAALTREGLRDGYVTVAFRHLDPAAAVEFRVMREGALPGKLRFRGVAVRYASRS